jgi:hypothetical protein
MLGGIVQRPERDYLHLLRGARGQLRPRGDPEPFGTRCCDDVFPSHPHRVCSLPADEQGGEKARESSQPQRRLRLLVGRDRQCAERPLQRRAEIKRRVGKRGCARQIQPGRPRDPHGAGRRAVALVGKFQRHRPIA